MTPPNRWPVGGTPGRFRPRIGAGEPHKIEGNGGAIQNLNIDRQFR